MSLSDSMFDLRNDHMSRIISPGTDRAAFCDRIISHFYAVFTKNNDYKFNHNICNKRAGMGV